MVTAHDGIRAALAHVPAHDRETWLRMGMAVKSELGDGGFDLWDEWSQQDASYREGDARAVWRSITPSGKVTVGTLYHEAQRHGFKLNGQTRPAPPTAEEVERRDEATAQREAEEAAKHEAAATLAARVFKAALPARSDHPYLERKGVAPVVTLRELPAAEVTRNVGYVVKSNGEPLAGRLLIAPVRSGDAISTLEFIDEAGRKSALAGGAKSGGYWSAQRMPEGDGDGLTLYVAEGVATALSVATATGAPTFAALSCGNLANAAKALHARYPKAAIVVCGDVGKERDAHKAAAAVGGLVAVPDFGAERPADATDFNDLAQHRGAEAVREAVARASAPEAPDGGNAAAGDSGGSEWPEPAPLPAELPAVEPFALDLVPDTLRPWICDIAERVQCPPDFPAVAAMVALGSVLGRRVAVFPKRFDNWHEFANLWGAIVGPPGVLKSPAIGEAMRPLRELEHEAAKANRDAAEDWRRQQVEAALMRDVCKVRARKAARDNKPMDVSALLTQDDDEGPALRRYIVNDSSVEALGEVLRGNPNGTMVYQDELISLLKLLDREGNEGARGFYLAGWSGKEPHTFDRIGRGLNRRIDAVCLSLFGSTQPAAIGSYLRDAVTTGGGDGLVARMSMLAWPDVPGEWRNVDRFPDSEARSAATEVFRRFDSLTPEAVGAGQESGDVYGLRFSDEAQGDFDEWREAFERAQRSGEDHPALVAHRNKYRKLVPALALVCHLADKPDGGSIGQTALLRALAWADYLDSHARRAYASVMRADADGARELLKHVRRGELPAPFRIRDVYRSGWSRLAEPDHARRAALLLVDFDYLREVPEPTGGRPTFVYHVNPRALQ